MRARRPAKLAVLYVVPAQLRLNRRTLSSTCTVRHGRQLLFVKSYKMSERGQQFARMSSIVRLYRRTPSAVGIIVLVLAGCLPPRASRAQRDVRLGSDATLTISGILSQRGFRGGSGMRIASIASGSHVVLR